MEKRRNVLQRLTESADLVMEPLPGMSLVEIAGDRRVLIENHGGVTQYDTNQIRVRVRYGQVCVQGTGLELAQMKKDQLVITGTVDTVSLLRGKC